MEVTSKGAVGSLTIPRGATNSVFSPFASVAGYDNLLWLSSYVATNNVGESGYEFVQHQCELCTLVNDFPL